MKTSHFRFAQLQKLLHEIGFTESRDEDGWRFEHPPSHTVFLFRPYRPAERVYEHDLFLVRSQLTGRGLVQDDGFYNSLTKTPA